jgi:uncharacterized protein
MAMRNPTSLSRLLLAFALLVLSACAADKPTRLYVLSPLAPKPAAVAPQGIAIGVGPITLPKYLDRPQMVTGVSGNQMSQANFDQWGGDLNDNITRVLADNLANLLATDRVSLYPWKDRAPIEYQITLDVTQFEQEASGATVLSAFWSIVAARDGSVLQMRRSTYRDNGAPAVGAAVPGEPGRPFDAVAGAMSRDLEQLSADIATAIKNLKGS